MNPTEEEEIQVILECKLCGLKRSGATKTTPCEECKLNFPTAKRCTSCGRIFPSSAHFKFKSSYCMSCDVRKMQKKISELSNKTYNQTKKIEEHTLSDTEFSEIADNLETQLDHVFKETEISSVEDTDDSLSGEDNKVLNKKLMCETNDVKSELEPEPAKVSQKKKIRENIDESDEIKPKKRKLKKKNVSCDILGNEDFKQKFMLKTGDKIIGSLLLTEEITFTK